MVLHLAPISDPPPNATSPHSLHYMCGSGAGYIQTVYLCVKKCEIGWCGKGEAMRGEATITASFCVQ